MKRRDELAREVHKIEGSLIRIGQMHWDNFVQTTL
jgi:hypothetical protein